jgi:hypothetical protein
MSGARTRRQTAEGPPAAETPARGQTTIDFAVGMSIFLLALAFVFVFVPGMLEPFDAGTQSETVTVNRVADDLTQRTLGNASQPYKLSSRCTRGLFEDSPPTDCRYSDGTMAERVGVSQRVPVNVTIRGDPSGDGASEMLCWEATAERYVERSNPDCGDEAGDLLLTRGPRPGGSGGKTVAARRVALLDGEDVTVEVVMW